MDSSPELNPWTQIWFHPKRTMRSILDHYPKRFVHLLVIISGFTHVVAQPGFSWFNSIWYNILVWIGLAIFFGLIYLYIFGGLIKWTGGWLKGQASMEQVMSALAWSQIPVLVFFCVRIGILAIVGWNGVNLVYASIGFIFELWAFVIFLCCLAEAQKFSFFRALVNAILGFVIIVATLIIINVIVQLIFGSKSQTTPQTG